MNYYNEWDKYAAQWLRNLIAAGHIPKGEVDERSIKDVTAGDLRGFTQCHFFAGLGGWSYALRLAGWPEDRECWTGSCPCQPFSVAGKRKGTEDERHLWPEFRRLIAERRPSVVFGEQVAAASSWLAGVRSDLEAMDYAVGAMPIEAACGGAPQYRDRFWFVADGERSERRTLTQGRQHDAIGPDNRRQEASGGIGVVAREPLVSERESQYAISAEPWQESRCDGGRAGAGRDGVGPLATVASSEDGRIQFIECPDGKFRRLPPPRVRWLGNGIPSRVAKLRAYGNAIHPPTAAHFISAYMGAL